MLLIRTGTNSYLFPTNIVTFYLNPLSRTWRAKCVNMWLFSTSMIFHYKQWHLPFSFKLVMRTWNLLCSRFAFDSCRARSRTGHSSLVSADLLQVKFFHRATSCLTGRMSSHIMLTLCSGPPPLCLPAPPWCVTPVPRCLTSLYSPPAF